MSRRAPHRVELLQPPSHSHRSQSLDNTLCAGLSVSIRQYIEQHSNNNKFEQVQTSWIKYFHYIATLYKLICLRTTLSSSLDQTRTQERGASKSRQKKLKLIPVQTCQKTIIGYFFPTFFCQRKYTRTYTKSKFLPIYSFLRTFPKTMDQPREQFVNIIRETYTSGNTRGLWKISIEKKISYPLFTLPEKFSIPKMKMAIKIEIIFGDDQSDDTRGLWISKPPYTGPISLLCLRHCLRTCVGMLHIPTFKSD